MLVGQGLLSNDVSQVGSHQMSHQVNLLECLQGDSRSEHVQQTHHVLMLHVLQVLQLAERAFGVDYCLERTNQLLEGDFHAVLRIIRCTENGQTSPAQDYRAAQC